MNVLIVEDDKLSAKQLITLLQSEGFSCDISNGVNKALEFIDSDTIYHIFLIDWNLDDGDGLNLIKIIRNEYRLKAPILMLSANSEITGKVEVLDSGGDDYICKPYSNIELLARMRALIRREKSEKSSIIKVENIELNLISHEIKVDGLVLVFTTSEYEILKTLLENTNIVLTRYQLLDAILANYNMSTNSNIIDVHIKNIRKKIQNQKLIQTIRGVGYSIRV